MEVQLNQKRGLLMRPDGSHRLFVSAGLFLISLALFGCQAEKKIAAAAASAAKTPAIPRPAAPSVTHVPTDAEAQQFGKTYIEALSKPNIPKAAQMIDWDMLFERATEGDVATERWRRSFIEGAKRSGTSLVDTLAKVISSGGDLTMLGIRTVNGEKRVVLRLLLPEGTLNYHEMVLVRDPTGFVRARDIYVYTSGEYFSETIQRLYMLAAASDPNMLERMSGKKNMFVEALPDYKLMMEKVRAGDGKAAIALYKRLPEQLRKQKSVLLAYVSASSKLGDDAAYAAAMDEMRATFPNDPGLDLMSIDSYLLKEKYDDALSAIDRVDKAVGGDPYLDVLRSNINLQRGDLEKAQVHAVSACDREPLLLGGWWSRVSVSLARKDFPETARLLTHIRDEMGVELSDLSTIPEYAEFVKSDAYRTFVR